MCEENGGAMYKIDDDVGCWWVSSVRVFQSPRDETPDSHRTGRDTNKREKTKKQSVDFPIVTRVQAKATHKRKSLFARIEKR